MVNDVDTQEEEDITPGSDKIFLSKNIGPLPSADSLKQKPQWASEEAEDMLDMVPHSTAHYMATVEINKKLINLIVDTGGARTMMDRRVAESLGLPIDKASKKKRYGSYWGPGGKETYYWGRVQGPVTVKVAEGVELSLKEIKIIEHGEPIMILGTDTLVDSEDCWRFCWVGLHPSERTG